MVFVVSYNDTFIAISFFVRYLVTSRSRGVNVNFKRECLALPALLRSRMGTVIVIIKKDYGSCLGAIGFPHPQLVLKYFYHFNRYNRTHQSIVERH